jgi:hypothetical protein
MFIHLVFSNPPQPSLWQREGVLKSFPMPKRKNLKVLPFDKREKFKSPSL